MFPFFRIGIILLTVLQLVLVILAFVGSYKNEGSLNNAYNINAHLTHLNVGNLLNISRIIDLRRSKDLSLELSNKDFEYVIPDALIKADDTTDSDTTSTKRGLFQDLNLPTISLGFLRKSTTSGSEPTVGTNPEDAVDPTETDGFNLFPTGLTLPNIASVLFVPTKTDAGDVDPTAVASSIEADPSGGLLDGIFVSINQILIDIVERFDYRDFGLSDVYSFSYWGYCKGYSDREDEDADEDNPKYHNNNINWTYCSSPKANWKFDPVDLLKTEMLRYVNGDVRGGINIPILTNIVRRELTFLINNISFENLNLAGNLNTYTSKLQRMNTAGFALLLTLLILTAISLIVQIVAIFFSPGKRLFSALNLAFLGLISVLAIITSALITAVFDKVKRSINNDTENSGVKVFLSANYYAYIWTATAITIIIVVLTLLGYFLGFFGKNDKNESTTVVEKDGQLYESSSGLEKSPDAETR